MSAAQQGETAAASAGAPFRRRGIRPWRLFLIIGGPLAIVLGLFVYFTLAGRTEKTDDAFVQIAKAPVAPSIGGRVIEIYVHENQVVRRGQLLFRLDPKDYETQVQAAEAELAAARLQVEAQRATLLRRDADLAAAQANLEQAKREADRTRRLVNAAVGSRQDLERAELAQKVSSQQVVAAEQARAEALAALGGRADLSTDQAPAVMRARAQLEKARLAVEYTTVEAPADGVVARVQQIPVGTYLNPSQTAFWLLSGKPWIEANFKENQLAKMKVGQPVAIEIDAFRDMELKGRVASFSPGTGSAFSALPAQNATGNWVKVTQRLPVRIELDKVPSNLAAGLSAVVSVDVRSQDQGR